jgi:hypothetical protein
MVVPLPGYYAEEQKEPWDEAYVDDHATADDVVLVTPTYLDYLDTMQQTNSPPVSEKVRDEMQRSKPVSKLFDWLTATFLVLGGLLFAAAGTGIYSLTDRERIAEWVADGTLTSTELSDAELIDTTHAFLTWGGVGMASTGLLLAIAGVAFLVYRTRVRQSAVETGARTASHSQSSAQS